MRINLMLLTTIGAVAILSGAFFLGNRSIGQSVDGQSQYSRLSQQVQTVEIGALQMRRSEKDFLLRRDVKYIDKYDRAVRQVEAALAEMSGMAASVSVAENVTNLQRGAARHSAQFHKVAELHRNIGLNEKEGQQGILRSAVHEVESKLKEAELDALTVKMLMMRRHEKDFMLRGAEKYIGRIDERRTEFDGLVKETTLAADTQAELTELMDAYQSGIKAYAETALQLKSETKKLSAIFAEMGPDFEAIQVAGAKGRQLAGSGLSAAISQTEMAFLIASISVLVLAVGLAFTVGRSIVGPIDSLTRTMDALADGDVNVVVPAIGQRDEIGEMAKSVQVFKDNAIERERLMSESENDQAQRVARQGKVDDLISTFRETVQAVLDDVSLNNQEMETTARSLSSIASQTTSKAENVSVASEEASANVEAVAAAAEELTASIGEITRQITQTKDIVGQASEATIETDTKIAGLADAAVKIGEVISLIQGIAEQTNLLALNATIEAARAGEAGKGFAVVASEVKELATQTAKATEAISEQITGIQKETDSSVEAIRGIAETMREVSSATEAIAAAVEEQGASTAEISNNVQRASAGSSEVSQNITDVRQAAGESHKSADQVLSTAQDASRNADKLHSVVDSFLGDVAAA